MKTEVIKALGLSTTDTAQALGVTHPPCKNFRTSAHLSPAIALRIEEAFGMSMNTPIQIQNSFAIAETPKWKESINVVPFLNQTTADAKKSAKREG